MHAWFCFSDLMKLELIARWFWIRFPCHSLTSLYNGSFLMALEFAIPTKVHLNFLSVTRERFSYMCVHKS